MSVCNNLYSYAIVEEVALEGLDGITIDALWLRLEDRSDFGLKPIVDPVKTIIWNVLKNARCILFYELPTPRKPLVIHNRFLCTNEMGHFIEPEHRENIYPHNPINDEENGVMGSCQYYYQRINVSEEVRDCSLETALDKWGCKLVIVANQETRRRALCGYVVSPTFELLINQYCVLERVGRGRQYGECTQGKYGLQVVTDDPKLLYYFRKRLQIFGLIKVQTFSLRCKNGNTRGKLCHLRRYYREIKTSLSSDAEKLLNVLKETPCKYIPYKDVFKLGLKAGLKKIMINLSKVLKSEEVPYRYVYPDAPPSAWQIKHNGAEKNIRILRLVESEKVEVDVEDEEEDEEFVGLVNSDKRDVAKTLIRQSYMAVERSHIMGRSQNSLAQELGLTPLEARSVCKQLKKLKLCGTMPSDVGRQRVTLYYCKKFESLKHSMTSVVAEEKNKLLQIASDTPSNSGNKRSFVSDTRDEPTVQKKSRLDLDSAAPDPPKPANNLDFDGIETEISVSAPCTTRGKTFDALFDKDSLQPGSHLTIRILKRAQIILQAVNSSRVITDPQKILKIINQEECLEGFNYNIDRKSVMRLLDKLEKDGHIKIIKVTIKGHGREKVLTIICHPSVSHEDAEVQSLIQQAKMKLCIISKEVVTRLTKAVSQVSDQKQGEETVPLPEGMKLEYNFGIGRIKYGFQPKFIRMKKLHQLMFYLAYDYTGHIDLDQDKVKRDIVEKYSLDPALTAEMGQIFQPCVSWNMFIPPLMSYIDFPEGWCLVSDILLRLPLEIFVNVVNTSYKIPNLETYLDHPVKKYYLVKDLPVEIKNPLVFMRKYIFNVSDIINQLAYIGLVQLGPQKAKEKDQVYSYVNRNAILFDTTASQEGYNNVSTDFKYEKKSYTFNVLTDVENYWLDLMKFALGTRLGVRSCMTGQSVVVESLCTKQQMIETLKPKTPVEAENSDVGYIPGDGKGAAGLDSDLFVHLKRNWLWARKAKDPNSHDLYPKKSLLSSKTERRMSKRRELSLIKPNDDDETHQEVPRVQSEIVQRTKIQSRHHRKITRVIRPRTKAPRRPYYDQKDKEAMKKMSKLRVDWSSAEDNLLLLCQVACSILYRNNRSSAKNFSIVRDFMHKHLPELSVDKTSRACQRRINYMMRSEATAHSVAVMVEEVKMNEDLISEFGHEAVLKLQNEIKNQKKSKAFFIKKMNEKFLDLVEKLLSSIKSVNSCSGLEGNVIPDSIAEFIKKYEIIVPSRSCSGYSEVQNTIDIMCSTVNSVVQSSLAGITDKTCYTYQLLHIYQQYPDKLVRAVMAKCQSMGIVSMRKQKTKILRGDYVLPLSSFQFQLSKNYLNSLLRHFQYETFHDNYIYFSDFIDCLKSSPEGFECKNNFNGGAISNLVELFSNNFLNFSIKVPEQVIVLDPKLSEKKETYAMIIKRFRDILSHIKGKTKKSDADTDKEGEIMREDGEFEEFVPRGGLANAASRLGLYMLRDDSSGTLDTNLQHAHDYFVLNPCQISTHFSDSGTALVNFHENKEEKSNLLDRIRNKCILSENLTIDEQTEEKYGELINFLSDKKELGATCKDIRLKFGYGISSALKELIEKDYLLETGSVEMRFVLRKFSKPWVIKTYRLPRLVRDKLAIGADRIRDIAGSSQDTGQPSRKRRKYSNISKEAVQKLNKVREMNDLPEMEVMIRPWIRVDGTLNRRVLDRLMGAVLSHVLSLPAQSVSQISERFVRALQPAFTFEIIRMLADLKCVSLVIVKASPVPSLFSKRSQLLPGVATCLEDTSEIFVEPQSMGITRFGDFIGAKAYSGDFMEHFLTT